MDRRRALTVLGAAGVGALATACAKQSPAPSAGASPSPSPGGDTSAGGKAPACVLAPELTEGPYYIELDKVRSDITEGRSGAPLKLGITVVDATSCKPVKDAAVDIWHCDASGEYSGFGSASGSTEMPAGAGPPSGAPPPGGPAGAPPPGGPAGAPGGRQAAINSERFLRGTQLTDASGVCTFQTIYPGWYTGRAVHIHFKVRTDSLEFTSQLFFTDEMNDHVFTTYSPYRERSRPAPDTTDSTDNIYGSDGSSLLLSPVSDGNGGFSADFSVGVSKSASTTPATPSDSAWAGALDAVPSAGVGPRAGQRPRSALRMIFESLSDWRSHNEYPALDLATVVQAIACTSPAA